MSQSYFQNFVFSVLILNIQIRRALIEIIYKAVKTKYIEILNFSDLSYLTYCEGHYEKNKDH